jgi:hypothetical protein
MILFVVPPSFRIPELTITSVNPEGDHKGPHPTPLLSRPYNDPRNLANGIKFQENAL